MVSYKLGINLGGWISQYEIFSKTHFDTFITEKDIEIIAISGFLDYTKIRLHIN
ncbi:UNVERIFIED_CONTAM: hypothetical protein Cloal_0867 [Acetivibrio alkalicellulosi]